MPELTQLLNKHFGYTAFLPGQREVIERVLSAENLLVVMPTGGGKSLCYQLPAMYFKGIVLVVSPLIALMKDQVDQLNSWDIPSTFINSSITSKEISQRLNEVISGQYRLVYVAPERFYDRNFFYQLQSVKIDLFVIDEAHCISEWGHDFRPSYLRLRKVAELLKVRSVIALTATATNEVRADICRLLGFSPENEIVTGFHRPNLFFMVHRIDKENKRLEKLFQILQRITGTVIVYASTRKTVEKITKYLQENGCNAIPYHAGLTDEERTANQERFLEGSIRIIVCTNAFGMGINKKDVRAVIHFNMPGSLEAYYQEAGRAGRDGKRSYCIMLFGAGDRFLQEFFIQGSYPPRQLIEQTYEVLDGYGEEIILKTHEELLKDISGKVNEMAVSSILRIFDEAGIVERLSERSHMASLLMLKTADESLEALGSRAELQRMVLATLIDLYDQALRGGVQFRPDRLATQCQVSKDSLMRCIRTMESKGILQYRAPFRGRGIRLLKRGLEPSDLPINYESLEQQSEREYGRLKKMEGYVFSNVCRPKYLLKYFGDTETLQDQCNSCDFCDSLRRGKTSCVSMPVSSINKTGDAPTENTVSGNGGDKKAVLATIGRYSGKFGQNIFVDIFKGSQNKMIRKWNLQKAQFYNYFSDCTREEIEHIIHNLIIEGYVDRQQGRYPVLSISTHGQELLESEQSDDKNKTDHRQKRAVTPEDRNKKIFQAIAKYGFDDKDLLQEKVTAPAEDIVEAIKQAKQEFMDYLYKKYMENE
ncbi:MAG: ATP-dependent DNA helicase RecQ [Candidatus Auribacterota bacterium]|jgi:ATP-dependent DNA helicase RecQ|nr:ATP-dependent DNA helicase RecQ [Candidatus Auribacterota bacterium]